MSGVKWNNYVKLDQVYYTETKLKVSDVARLELPSLCTVITNLRWLIYSLQKIILV